MKLRLILLHIAIILTCNVHANKISANDHARIEYKIEKLPTIDYPAMPRSKTDWLINAEKYKAKIGVSKDKKSIILSNGLVARVFRVYPNLATIDIVNQMTSENMLRAVSSEGQLVIDGKTWSLGGLDGQPERGYLNLDWLEDMTVSPNSFIIENFETTDTIQTLEWPRKRWSLNKKNPTGKTIVFTMRGVDEVKKIKVKLYYEIYDHLPVIGKYMRVYNSDEKSVNLSSFKLEYLHFAEPESPVGGDPATFLLPNIHIESNYHAGGNFTERETDCTEHWITDKKYTSQTNYKLQTPCTLEVSIETGPDVDITNNHPFESYKVYEMPFDTRERERCGLFKRRFYHTITPWATQNPIFMHLTSTNPDVVRRAVDQCVECGYEMIILSFGSGLRMEDISEANISKFKDLVNYANARGIEMGCYSLLASRWISDEVDVINPETGKRGGMRFGSSPCLCSNWGYEYFDKIETFLEKTGMTCFEHDGSYPGDVCASTSHTHHKGLGDSQWKQFHKIAGLYNRLLKKGVYMNVPDFYLLNGSTKVGIGYREVNWSLPRDRQLIHTRQINYNCTWERLPSSLWSFVPLVQYHGGGAEAILEPLSEHLYEYKTLMFQNYGAGIQACYRGPRLYDTEETKKCVVEIIDWYKKYREILNSDIIHLRRPDAKDWDGIMHVNPKLKEKALAMFFNPTDKEIVRTVELPLYYTGLEKVARIREGEGRSKKHKLNRNYSVNMQITIPAKGYTWYVVE